MRLVASVLFLAVTLASPVGAPGQSTPPPPLLPIDTYHDAILLEDTVEGLVDIEQRPWDALVFHPDGRTVDVYFTGTDPACTVLHSVDVGNQPAGLEILIMTGRPPDVAGCREPLLRYVVSVELERTLFQQRTDDAR